MRKSHRPREGPHKAGLGSRKGRRAKRWFRVLPSIAILLTIALIEIGTRVLLPEPSSFWVTIDSLSEAEELKADGIFNGDALLGWMLKKDLQDVSWGVPGQTPVTRFSTDATGFRRARYPTLDEPGLRIVCLGDSVTFGYGLDFGPFSDSAQTATGLPTDPRGGTPHAIPEARVQVIPMAVPGYSSSRAWSG